MAPARPLGRPLLLLLALLVAVMAIMWWPQPPVAEPEAPSPTKTAVTPLAADSITAAVTTEVGGDISRQEATEEAAAPASGDPAQQVAVHFWITTNDDEEPGHAPPDAQAWRAVAQTWLEATGETFRHEATFNEHGMASFRFDGFTHVDWFAAIPPAGSIDGFDAYEGHDDYEPGSQEDIFLKVAPGGSLIGRVVDMQGRPVVGAEVDLNPESTSGLDYTPGYLRTTTGADGGFRFAFLAADRDWGVSVVPGRWVMIDPQMDDADWGHGMAEVTVDPLPADVGTLVVAPGRLVTVEVVDRKGVGVPSVEVSVQALHYFDPQWRDPPQESPTPAAETGRSPELQAFLDGRPVEATASAPSAEPAEAEGLENPYEGYQSFTTDSQGRCHLPLLPGQYELSIDDYPGMDPEAEDPSIYRDFDTGQRQVVVALPCTLGGFRGRLLDQEDGPVAGAVVYLGSDFSDDFLTTDADGRFHLDQMPLELLYYLSVEEMPGDRQLANGSWEVHAQAEPLEQVFRVQEGFSTYLSFVQQDGQTRLPLPEASIQVQAWRPAATGTTPMAPDWLDRFPFFLQTDRNGKLIIDHMLPGELDIALLLPVASSAVDEFGNARTDLQIWQQWTVPVQGGWQTLIADLSQYQRPLSRATDYVITVLDQLTGLPVEHVQMTLTFGAGQQRRLHVSDGRSIHTTLPRTPVKASIRAHGYLAYSGQWDPGEAETLEKTIHLNPGKREISVYLLDRDGSELPNGQVVLTDAATGERREADAQAWASYPRMRGTLSLINSHVRLHDPMPGALRLRANLFGFSGASAVIQIPSEPGERQVTAYLDMSLEEIRAALLENEKEE